jgi:hypothetical protein
MIQTCNLLDPFQMEQTRRDAIMRIANAVMLRLVACYDRAEPVIKQVTDGKRRIEEKGVEIQAAGMVAVLPSVIDLQANVEGFLYSAKQALRELAGLFEPFYQQRFDHRFQRIRKWAEERFGKDDRLVRLLEADRDWIERLVSDRNAVEHPGGGDGTLIIQNFRVASASPPVAIVEPTWQKDPRPPSPIADDMETVMHNLLTLFEDLLCDSLLRLPSPIPLAVYEIPEVERDPQVPIRFKIIPRNLPSFGADV